MPFTLAHPAAALPIARCFRALPLTALVVGSMAPDLEYMVRLRPAGSFAHSLMGLALVTFPASVLVFLIAERLLLPSLRHVLCLPGLPIRYAHTVVLIALAVGILSHIAWDSFTHPSGLLVTHWSALTTSLHGVPIYKLLQHLSSVFGISAIAYSAWHNNRPVLKSHLARVGAVMAVLVVPSVVAGLVNASRGSSIRDRAGLFAIGALDGAVIAAVLASIFERTSRTTRCLTTR